MDENALTLYLAAFDIYGDIWILAVIHISESFLIRIHKNFMLKNWLCKVYLISAFVERDLLMNCNWPVLNHSGARVSSLQVDLEVIGWGQKIFYKFTQLIYAFLYPILDQFSNILPRASSGFRWSVKIGKWGRRDLIKIYCLLHSSEKWVNISKLNTD